MLINEIERAESIILCIPMHSTVAFPYDCNNPITVRATFAEKAGIISLAVWRVRSDWEATLNSLLNNASLVTLYLELLDIIIYFEAFCPKSEKSLFDKLTNIYCINLHSFIR